MSIINELIKRLRERSDYFEWSGCAVNGVIKDLRQAADTIEELSAKLHNANMERSTAYYNNGWIPCSERLPEKNDVYLVAINSYGCPTRDVDGFVSQSVRKWEMYGKSVVAWMPLPEPYKASPTGAEGSDKE